MTMEESNGQKAEKHRNAEQQLATAMEICELVAQGYTLKSACESKAVTDRTFRRWRSELSAVSAAYKRAMDEYEQGLQDRLKRKAELGLEKLVEGYTWERKRATYKPDPKNPGQGKLVEEQIETRDVRPNAAAVFFVLTNTNPLQWRHRQDVRQLNVNQVDDGVDLSKLSPEELEAYEQLLLKAAGG